MDDFEDARTDGEGQNPSRYLAVVWRRKWILLLCVTIGLVIGFVNTFQKPRIYQSSSQVMLSRKRQPALSTNIGAGLDTRLSYLEDFVGTQVLLLKSDLILRNAAEKTLPILNLPGAGDVESTIGMLGGGLGVVRDKDAGGRNGTNVVMFTFRNGSQELCPRYLDAIIKSYQDFLKNKYDTATEEEIRQIDKTIKEMEEELKKFEDELITKSKEDSKVYEESLEDLRKRVSSAREQFDALERRQLVVKKKLELIDKIGPDSKPQERAVLLAQLSVQGTAGNPQMEVVRTADLEVARLESELQLRLSFVGASHPEVTSLKSKIGYLREQASKLKGGGGGASDTDTIDFQKVLLEAEREANNLDMKGLGEKLKRDAEAAQKLGSFTAMQNNLEERKKRFLNRKEELERTKRTLESTKDSGGYEATLLQPPSKSPVIRVEPNMFQGTIMGGLLGLLIGIGFAALAELTDRTFHSADEIRSRLGVPVIAHVPTLESDRKLALDSGLDGTKEKLLVDPSIVTYHAPKSRSSEAVRGLRTSIYFSMLGRGHQVIQVSSPNPGDGKSTVTANLAVSIAQSGKTVLLIDADLRKPRVHKLFPSVKSEYGLSSVIIGEKTAQEAIQSSGIENLSILPAGSRPNNPAELLSSHKFQEFLSEVRKQFDFVLVDTPPMLAVSDPAAVASCVDGLILVIRIRPNIRPATERSREMLRSLGVKVLGVVVNSSDSQGATYGSSYSYGAGYNYGYGYKYAYNYDYAYSESYNQDDRGETLAIEEAKTGK